MRKVRAITFDLDDTLWEIAPVIARAERKVYDEIQIRFPRVSQRYALEDIQAVLRFYVPKICLLFHNVLRFQGVIFLASSFKY